MPISWFDLCKIRIGASRRASDFTKGCSIELAKMVHAYHWCRTKYFCFPRSLLRVVSSSREKFLQGSCRFALLATMRPRSQANFPTRIWIPAVFVSELVQKTESFLLVSSFFQHTGWKVRSYRSRRNKKSGGGCCREGKMVTEQVECTEQTRWSSRSGCVCLGHTLRKKGNHHLISVFFELECWFLFHLVLHYNFGKFGKVILLVASC